MTGDTGISMQYQLKGHAPDGSCSKLITDVREKTEYKIDIDYDSCNYLYDEDKDPVATAAVAAAAVAVAVATAAIAVAATIALDIVPDTALRTGCLPLLQHTHSLTAATPP